MNPYLILNSLRDFIAALLFTLIICVGQQAGLANGLLTVAPNLYISEMFSALTFAAAAYFTPMISIGVVSKAWDKLTPIDRITRIETAFVYAVSLTIGMGGFFTIVGNLSVSFLPVLAAWLFLPALLVGYVRAIIIFTALNHLPEPDSFEQASAEYENDEDSGYWPRQVAAFVAALTFMSGMTGFAYFILVLNGTHFPHGLDNTTIGVFLISVAAISTGAGAAVGAGKFILRQLGLFKATPADHPGRAYFTGMVAISAPFCIVPSIFAVSSSDDPAFIGFGLIVGYIVLLLCMVAAGSVYGSLVQRDTEPDELSVDSFA